jgi:hypothetical protein
MRQRSRTAVATTGSPEFGADYAANYFAAFVVDPDGIRLEAYCGEEV